jgi:hypothetical protein
MVASTCKRGETVVVPNFFVEISLPSTHKPLGSHFLRGKVKKVLKSKKKGI